MGVLRSAMFADIQVFEDCAVDDTKHIMPGTVGWHIVMIQGALATVGGQKINEREVDKKFYGISTATAVANFKRSQKPPLLNYRNQIDSIVGKKTIVALDDLMAKRDKAAADDATHERRMNRNRRVPRDPHRPVAKIGSVGGDVWITTHGREQKATPDMLLVPGNRIRTGRAGSRLDKLLSGELDEAEKDGQVTVIWLDKGNEVTFGPNALIVILHDSSAAPLAPDDNRI